MKRTSGAHFERKPRDVQIFAYREQRDSEQWGMVLIGRNRKYKTERNRGTELLLKMLRNWEYRSRRIVPGLCAMLLLICLLIVQSGAIPMPAQVPDYGSSSTTSAELANATVDNDLYVIKAVVYEIGILTDADNSTDTDETEKKEEVNISIYNHPGDDNGSSIIPETPASQYALLNLLNVTV